MPLRKGGEIRERVAETRPQPRRLDLGTEANALPECLQPRHAILRRVAGDDRAVDCADRRADDPVGLDARLVQRLIDADLVGAQRTAALQHQDHLARQFESVARGHLHHAQRHSQ